MARDIGQDPEYVIAATHGKRAVDNLSQFKPHLADHEIEREVERFENTILYYADAYHRYGPGSGSNTPSDVSSSGPGSADDTPALTPGPSAPQSRRSSIHHGVARRPSFGSRLLHMLSVAARLRGHEDETSEPLIVREEGSDEESVVPLISESGGLKPKENKVQTDTLEAWQAEAASVDRSVRILPGVRKMIDSLPEGRYAVATSGAKTYGMSSLLFMFLSLYPLHLLLYVPLSVFLFFFLCFPPLTVDLTTLFYSLWMHETSWNHSSSRHYHRG